MKIGVLVNGLDNIAEKLRRTADNGFERVQINSSDVDNFTDEMAAEIRRALEATGITATTFWCGWPGPAAWNFVDGPLTLGLVPESYRHVRTEVLLKGVDFAHKCGIPQIATHAGFIPEDLNDPLYAGTLVALKRIVRRCRELDICFLFETGQETPVTLLRTIEDLGGDNVGINFDTGNLILYGKGNPVDALDVFGKYVRDFHCKDGLYPTDGRHLGREVPLGQGKVDWPALIKKLKEMNYSGDMTIEREIKGEQQAKDIAAAKAMLDNLWETV